MDLTRRHILRGGAAGLATMTAMRLIIPPNQFYTDELLVGAGANYNGSLVDNNDLADYLLVTWPSATWNGTAGSGFAATPYGSNFAAVPVDPARTTAKPAMRLIIPPNQFYTDELLVGVFAGANYNGSLVDNMGLEKVTVYYEGTVVDILKPGFRTFADANGRPVTYFGWWISLHHDGRNGNANLYFEAVPKDTTMQRRVLGPYQFTPTAALYDYDLAIAPSQSVIIGSRYQTPADAINYLRSVSAKNPRIRLTETATYSSWNARINYVGDGWLTVEAPAGVAATIAYADYATIAYIRTRYNRMHFKGNNILFDMQHISAVMSETGTSGNHWLDGVRVTNSTGTGRLWEKRLRPNPYIVSGAAWLTECTIDGVGDPVRGCGLARGCTVTNCWSDIMSGARLAMDNKFIDCTNIWLRKAVDALTVKYNGSGASATVAISNRPGYTRTITATVDDATVGTLTMTNDHVAYAANTAYSVRNVVDWLNGLPGFTATLLYDEFSAAYLGAPGTGDAPTPATDVRTSTVAFKAEMFVHGDLYASEAEWDNIIVSGNYSYGGGTDGYNSDVDLEILFGGSAPIRDWLVLNNCFYHHGNEYWQIGATPNSHIVIAHNTAPTYVLGLRTDSAKFNLDSYCLIANNACREMGPVTAPYAGLYRNNHTVSAPTLTLSGQTVGGTVTTLVANGPAGDFTPGSDLRANLKLPSAVFDLRRIRRFTLDTVGAISSS